MANMSKNIDLFDDEQPDSWRKQYWKDKSKAKTIKEEKADDFFYEGASVKTVLKERDPKKESADFFKAQLDMTKDLLPKETIAQKGTTVDNDRVRLDLFDQQWHRKEDFAASGEKMMPTPLDAYHTIYPSGNPVPVSPNMKPTSSIAEYPVSGYRGDDGVPQGKIGSLQLETKGDDKKWIGDHYLPKQCQDGKDNFTPPKNQLSSAKECNINIGSLIEDALNKKTNNMNTVIDMSASIASTKEKKVLNKPFKTPTGKTAYAVYVKNDKEEIVRVGFNACQASDPTNIGPRWMPLYWGAKVNPALAAEAKEQTLDQMADFYTEKVTDPKADADWDGKTFYRQDELIKSLPKLVNSKPSYEDETVVNKTDNTGSSEKINPERKEETK